MIKLTFLGDVMCKQEMIAAHRKKDGYDFDLVFQKMSGYFETSDYIFANLETPISVDSTDLTNAQFCFNSPYEFAESLYKSGVNFVATANNHCLDRGIKGLVSTIESLDRIGLEHTGTFLDENKALSILNVKGVTLGVLSYTYGTNAHSNNNYLNKENAYMVNLFQNQEVYNPILRYLHLNPRKLPIRIINKIMRELKIAQWHKKPYERTQRDKNQKRELVRDINRLKEKNVDFIIMYMHAGGQYSGEPTKYVKKLVEFLHDNGVNIIVGSHEHVVHGGDFSDVNDNFVATYSLGNFDGIAGVYSPPFDKMSEYSIAWNIYLDENEKKIEKMTFSVLKTVEILKQQVQTIPAYDIISTCECEKEKYRTTEDVLKIAKIFSGIDYKQVQCEFEMT